MATGGSNLVDWLTLVAAGTAAIAVPAVAFWKARREDREVLELAIEWKDFGPNARYTDAPFLHVLNKSKHPVGITEVNCLRGAFSAKRVFGTVMTWEDPIDIDFPYIIKPTDVHRFMLNEDMVKQQFARVPAWQRWLGKFRRPSVWIEIQTMSGKRQRIGGEDVLPWPERPEWRKRRDDDA